MKKMRGIIDTHTHIFLNDFDADRAQVVERALNAGIEALCLPSVDYGSIGPIMDMCNSYPSLCYPMIGLHPTEVGVDYRIQLDRIYAALVATESVIAVGEVGLDFYWDDTYKEQQLDAFKIQMDWARELNLPLAIHSRNAFDELYSAMCKYEGNKLSGIFHCFSGSNEEARKLLAFEGFMLGVGGVVTYKNSTLPQVLKEVVPLERIVLETDSPYLAPVPYRGRRNESSYLVEVVKFLSGLYGCSEEHVREVTTTNAECVFKKINSNENRCY